MIARYGRLTVVVNLFGKLGRHKEAKDSIVIRESAAGSWNEKWMVVSFESWVTSDFSHQECNLCLLEYYLIILPWDIAECEVANYSGTFYEI